MSVSVKTQCTCDTSCTSQLGQCPENWGGQCNGSNCMVLRVCEDNKWVLPMYGCNPLTGKDLKFSDVSLFEFEAEYNNGEGYVGVLSSSVAISASGSYAFCVSIPRAATGCEFADGACGLNGRIYATINGTRHLYYQGDICVEQLRSAAPPHLAIGCSISLFAATLDLSDSDPVHDGRAFGDVTIDWGDDSAVETVPYTNAFTHEYAEDGTYTVMVTLCLARIDGDGSDSCECNVCETHSFDICINYVNPLTTADAC